MTTTPPPCCDMHNQHCEPPAELCCNRCSEANHPFHPPGVSCTWASDADVAFAQGVQRLAGREPPKPSPLCPVAGCGAGHGSPAPMKCRGFGSTDERCMANWASIDPEDQGTYRDYLAWLTIEPAGRPAYWKYLDAVNGGE